MTLKITSLALFLLFASCRVPEVTAVPPTASQPSPTASLPVVANVKGNSDTDKQNELAAGINITVVEKLEKNDKLLYRASLRYPQIKQPRTQPQRQFNRLIQNQIQQELNWLKAFCADNKTLANGKKRDVSYTLTTEYSGGFANGGIISLTMYIENWAGYVHPDRGTLQFNYDLKAGKELKLKDLFVGRVNYLKRLSEESRKQLQHMSLNCSGQEGLTPQAEAGTQPQIENFSEWTLSSEGLAITFKAYQIGPGCLGMKHIVIPFDSLKDVIKPEIIRRLNENKPI
jgi:hypothetical protein